MTIDRRNYASVSEILKPWSDYSHIDLEVLRRKQIIGKEVHEAIKAYYLGEFFPVSPLSENYFESFLKWTKKQSIYLPSNELECFDDAMKVRGICDMIAKNDDIPKDTYCLYDFKCSSTAKLAVWELQGMMYSRMLADRFKMHDHFYFVQLHPKGDEPLEWKVSITDTLWINALSAINLHWHFQGMAANTEGKRN